MSRTLTVLVAAALLSGSCGGNMQRKGAAADRAVPAVCDSRPAEDPRDVAGSYAGTIPAADCPGIGMLLTLRADSTYLLHMRYLEREAEYDEEGAWRVAENLLTLTPADGEGISCYRVEQGRLRMLDADKQPVPGEAGTWYVLYKTDEKDE